MPRLTPPAKLSSDVEGRRVSHSLVSGGCIIGSGLRNTPLCETCTQSFGKVDHGVILPYVDIGRARLTNVIVDSGYTSTIRRGVDPARCPRFRRTESGICLITRDDRRWDRLTLRSFAFSARRQRFR
jgi:ADP-glucose pyrophosphorylase